MKVNTQTITSKSNRTGVKGLQPVTAHKGTVGAHVRVQGRSVWVGTYASREEAAAARNGAINVLARLGLVTK